MVYMVNTFLIILRNGVIVVKASNNNYKIKIKHNLKLYRKKIDLVFNRTAILAGLKSYLYIFFIMFRDLLSKIFFGFVISYFKLKKQSGENYNSKIVTSNKKEVIAAGRTLGIITSLIIIYVVIIYSGIDNLNILIPGILIAVAMGQQMESAGMEVIISHMRISLSTWNTVIYIFAKRKRGENWNEVVEETEMFWMHPQIHPVSGFSESLKKIEGKLSEDKIIKHINKYREEINYYVHVEDNNSSKLKFTDHTVKFLHNIRDKHDALYEIRERIGTWTYIIYLGTGTIIWLISPF